MGAMYAEIDFRKVGKLRLKRDGFFVPEYLLTDDVSDYGDLSYDGFNKRSALAVTANTLYRFNFDGWFTNTIAITNSDGEVIGRCTRELFSRTYQLHLESGFTASFYRPNFFSSQYVWQSDGYGDIIGINNRFPFSLTTDIDIYQSKAPTCVMPLLMLLGQHLIILNRRRRAVH